jgi:ACS family hexuronate transporter-like MFS transporter
MPSSVSLRWIAVSVFVISSTLNYLDRGLLNTLGPLIMNEFHLNKTAFGGLISAFSIAYAASTLGAGWVLDRFGVNRGIAAAVSWWSTAAIGTAMISSVPGLALCRAALGIGESAGVPAVGKLNAIYLKPEERALGAAANQVGLALAAPLASFCVAVAIARGWRLPFIVTGLCGFLWLPLWFAVNRAIPAQYTKIELASREERRQKPLLGILRDRNLLLLVGANVLCMPGYSLWTNWTTFYLIDVHHLSLAATASYSWIPPLVSILGGFFGGWLSLRWVRRGGEPVASRRKAVWVSATGSLLALFLPLAPGPVLATGLISLSFFFALAGSVNIYALPIDIFGAKRSGVAIAALTCGFGIMQAAVSPVIGHLLDRKLYTPVLWMVTIPLLGGALLLGGLRSDLLKSE